MDAKKYLRMKKPLSVNDIKYYDSSFFLKEVPGSVMPMDTFLLMNKVLLDSSTKKQFIQELYDLGCIQSKEILTYLVGNNKLPHSQDNVRFVMQPIAMAGLGDLKIIKLDFNNCHSIFRIKSKFAIQYKKLFSGSHDVVDHFLAGMITGCLEYFFKKKFKTVEKVCMVQGKPACIFNSTVLGSTQK